MNTRCRLGLAAAVQLFAAAVAAPAARAGSVPAWSAAAVEWADPAPLGISYEWTVTMGRRQTAAMVGHVGALAWNIPTQPEGLKGWTHWSNWIALELTEAASVTVTVERQQGVMYSDGASEVVARAALVPALTFYAGRDDATDPEEHRYDNAGNFWSIQQNKVDIWRDVGNGVVKSAVFGVICTFVALYQGYETQATPEGVAYATTRTVVISSLAVLAMDFILTALMFSTP